MGGGGGGFLTSRGTANVLTRTTAILAAAFFATSLVLSILAGIGPQAALDPAGPERPARRPRNRPIRAEPRRSAPGGVLDRLRKAGAGRPRRARRRRSRR